MLESTTNRASLDASTANSSVAIWSGQGTTGGKSVGFSMVTNEDSPSSYSFSEDFESSSTDASDTTWDNVTIDSSSEVTSKSEVCSLFNGRTSGLSSNKTFSFSLTVFDTKTVNGIWFSSSWVSSEPSITASDLLPVSSMIEEINYSLGLACFTAFWCWHFINYQIVLIDN